MRAAESLSVPEYKIGEAARADVVATVSIVVIDPEKTEALKLKESQRVPVIYRFDTNATGRAVGRLRQAFAGRRENFVASLRSTFNHHPLDESDLGDPRFASLVGSFQSWRRGAPSFPLSSNLAHAWALGEPDSDLIAPFEERLQIAMTRFIRPQDQPPEARIGWQVKLVPGDRRTAPLPAEVARARGLARSNVVNVTTFRGDFANQFPRSERNAARFVAGFIEPNCFPDVSLTREMRAKQIEGISSVTRYEPGDLIVRADQVVSRGIKAALDEYRGKLALVRSPDIVQVRVQVPAPPSLAPWYWAGGVCVAALGLVVLLWLRLRRRTMALALVPESFSSDTVAAVRDDPVIRARLVEHFTRLLGQSVVQRLLAQRGELLDTQHSAAVQTVDLEQRLEKVHSDMQERFVAYEQRIAELEKELTVAEEQNRDLIRAKIAIARQELEAERARQRVDWN